MLWLRIAQLSVGLACISAFARTCGDAEEDGPVAPDGGTDASSVVPTQCPTIEPAEGAACSEPEGTTCGFGTCGARLAVCRSGIWRFSKAPSVPSCPVVPPDLEARCPACFPVDLSCRYGSCSAADASTNTVLASCIDGGWSVTIQSCQDAGDAGPDVQGDAGADGG